MKAVLISIQPKWCELIASGRKTVEVRKSKPKLDVPFKVYIYCSKAKEKLLDVLKEGSRTYGGEIYHGETQFIKGEEGSVCDMWGKRQKVIGEFICDRFIPIAFENGVYSTTEKCGRAYMTVEEALKYGKEKPLFGWHISDLKIYDKPKELSEFYVYCHRCDERPIACKFAYEESNESGYYSECMCDSKRPIEKPPQSWCYVEELKEGADNAE